MQIVLLLISAYPPRYVVGQIPLPHLLVMAALFDSTFVCVIVIILLLAKPTTSDDASHVDFRRAPALPHQVKVLS